MYEALAFPATPAALSRYHRKKSSPDRTYFKTPKKMCVRLQIPEPAAKRQDRVRGLPSAREHETRRYACCCTPAYRLCAGSVNTGCVLFARLCCEVNEGFERIDLEHRILLPRGLIRK